MDVDGEEDEEVPKAIKRKPPKPEESKSKKEHVNVVFIGHVGEFCVRCCVFSPPTRQQLTFSGLFLDAGKSTIGGQIMALTGMVDRRTLEKYEREAREKSRESWYYAWALDTNQEGKF